MTIPFLRASDAGVPISLSIGGTSDLTGATGVLKFQLPSGIVITRAATLASRTLTYSSVSADFTLSGTVIVQGLLTLASGDQRHTGRAEFTVEATL